MAKTKASKTGFFCKECGHESVKWMGRCPACEEWDSFVEEPHAFKAPRGLGPAVRHGGATPIRLAEIEEISGSRISTNVGEFDRVLGGGLVAGSVTLIAGDPGIGKSTLMTQMSRYIPERKLLYVTGEESPQQTKMRADRLGVSGDSFFVLAETRVEDILAGIVQVDPDIVIIDSVQTLYSSDVSGSPGSVGQVRACTAAIIQAAKQYGIATFVVGHVTKDGQIAGPRVLEHMVDTVLYFEGDRHHSYRILRSVKNRFGSTNEIGLFEMGKSGLEEISDPSSALIANRTSQSGSAVVCPIEGTRPVLVEIQALVTAASYGTPQRSVNGVDSRRLQMLLAVLEKRVGLRLGGEDIFINVAGGLKIDEPGVDLGLALAIVSSHRNQTIPIDTLFIGEVGLGGEVRPVPQVERRLNEAGRLGFKHALVPAASDVGSTNIHVHPVTDLAGAIDLIV